MLYVARTLYYPRRFKRIHITVLILKATDLSRGLKIQTKSYV